MEQHNNKWMHGPTAWERFDFPQFMRDRLGIFTPRVALTQEIGVETILCIREEGQNLADLDAIRRINLILRGGVIRTSFGPVVFFLFRISNLDAPEPTLTYEMTINPYDPPMFAEFWDLARQTHWHVFVLNKDDEEVRWFEIENHYGLDKSLQSLIEASKRMPYIDFNSAKAEYESKYSIDYLLDLTDKHQPRRTE